MPEARRDLCRRRAFGISAGLLLVLDLVLAVPVTMMAALDKPVSMGLIPAIAMAAYTTWKITMASIRLSRRGDVEGAAHLAEEMTCCKIPFSTSSKNGHIKKVSENRYFNGSRQLFLFLKAK